ncbi:MAG: hypothetical protein K2L85_07075 [Paramuribaculum sp.]|nr:hypothetical protein [Paramuribaculum sp.]
MSAPSIIKSAAIAPSLPALAGRSAKGDKLPNDGQRESTPPAKNQPFHTNKLQ